MFFRLGFYDGPATTSGKTRSPHTELTAHQIAHVSWPGLVARSTAAVRASRWLNRRGSPVVTVLVPKAWEVSLGMHTIRSSVSD